MRAMLWGVTFAAGLLLARPCAGQSVAELLQKGIYSQETAGDVDGAIRIYRQIIASATELRAYAAQAQYRLAQCLLQQGDKAAAAKALEKLKTDYSEQTALLARARQSMPELAAATSAEYDDPRLPVAFTLPAGWSVNEVSFLTAAYSEGTVYMQTACCTPPFSRPAVWFRKMKTAPQDILPDLRRSPVDKATGRESGWRVRPESIQERVIGGAHAISCIADTGQKGVAEYLVWLQTENTRALFFCRMATGELEQAIPHFDRFLDTIRLK